jgi:glycosyltransferase involved in cell wall biosynthesis
MIERTEEEIMQHWEGDANTPVVSVCTITYNHEDFIEEALDSFLMQETAFPFELVVDDDCSPDGTADIIRKYMEKYPNIMNVRLRDENVGFMTNFIENIQRANGKYIALCEGDDYWTDPLKLQKQVDFMENNLDVILVFQNAMVHYYNDSGKLVDKYPFNQSLEKGYKEPYEILEKWIAQTATVLFRNNTDVDRFMSRNIDFPIGDAPTFLYVSQFGKLYYDDIITTVYRATSSGVVRSSLASIESRKQYIEYYKKIGNYFKKLNLTHTLNKLMSHEYLAVARDHIQKKEYIYFFKYLVLSFYKDPVYVVNLFSSQSLKKLYRHTKENVKLKEKEK